MRSTIVAAAIAAAAIAGSALAQTGPPAAKQPPAKMPAEPLKETGTDAFKSCVSQWEKATHMSRREWERACRRVADRLQNLTVK
jgi:hypothetical protein